MRLFNLNTPKIVLPVAAMLFAVTTHAQTAPAQAAPATHSILSNGVFITMMSVIALLLLGIIAMAEVVKAGGAQRRAKAREEKEKSGNSGKTVATIALLLFAGSLFAQTAPAASDAAAAVPENPFLYWGLGAITFWCLLVVIIFEGIIFYMLFRTGMKLLRYDELRAQFPIQYEDKRSIMESPIMKSMTDAVPIEQEAAIMMDHDYDGIRELDNNLPPWWKYGFYLTIVVGIIYLVNYHVVHNGKSSAEEYKQDSLDLESKVAAYKKANANLVDENNVTLLIDATSINAGKAVYTQNCVPCHGANSEGKEGLGPNLTDDYWIHKGGVVDIFKSVKYGWTEKGMKSWQQDLKPLEIQQVVSYIKSIRGSNPANAQPPQGDLYVESSAAPSDSLKTPADSLKVGDSIPVMDSIKK
jgi:cytochrome c oxidase cbb3-type subunit 3